MAENKYVTVRTLRRYLKKERRFEYKKGYAVALCQESGILFQKDQGIQGDYL